MKSSIKCPDVLSFGLNSSCSTFIEQRSSLGHLLDQWIGPHIQQFRSGGYSKCTKGQLEYNLGTRKIVLCTVFWPANYCGDAAYYDDGVTAIANIFSMVLSSSDQLRSNQPSS